MDSQIFMDGINAKIDEIHTSIPDDLNREGELVKRFRLMRDFLTQHVYTLNNINSSLTGYDCGCATGFYIDLKRHFMGISAWMLNPSLMNVHIAHYDLHYAPTLGPLSV